MWKKRSGILLCYPFEEKRLAKWEPPYIVQPKYDGVRCRAVQIPNGNYILLSSEENIYFSVPHINKELEKLHITNNLELDGELYHHGMSFEKIVSITSRTVNLANNKDIQYHLFDLINDSSQIERLLQLEEFNSLSQYIKVSPYWICNSLDEIMKVYDKIIKLNYEGIIIRHLMAPYIRRRSVYVMKFKPKKSDEYKIVGYNEEISKNNVPKGTLGSLVCTGINNNLFKVGSGFTAQDRKEYWNRREELIGKVCKISYQHLTDKKIPRFPVFCEVLNK